MEKYYHALIRYLTVRLRDNHLAADVAHDAYVRVLERGETDAVKHPQAYLYRTAVNVAIDVHRHNRDVRGYGESFEDIQGFDEGQQAQVNSQFLAPHDSLYLRERTELLERALGELSDECREAFLLRKLEGLSHPAIAEQMGISKSMVEKHIVNAMKHCRIRVKEMEYSILDPDDAARRYTRAKPVESANT
ncbi:sigma-70 family RNA polymerase sigma factor [Pseudomonas sp. FME51]|uniref:sigma-70 family RNA polymerase sigma factor n=1 Tax=Pseudomonas sp. FME51 TaxID=2742609 RepID=UPI00186765D2|nr:sigma-70 family RNA polymerase sigma factor [Pseudomonas sp. FME51]